MYDLPTWLDNINNLLIGEFYINSMDKDGTGQGYQFDLLDVIPSQFSIPVILYLEAQESISTYLEVWTISV